MMTAGMPIMDKFDINIFKALTDYGALIVIAGIFLYCVIRLANVFFKFLDNKFSKVRHDKALSIREEVGIKIQSLINDLLVDCDCDRVQVIEFSNSVMSVAYLPFKYMSCTYEVYKFGKTSIGHTIDKITTSLFTQFFAQLEDKEYCQFDVHSKPPYMGGAMCDLLKQSGNTKELCVKMVTNRDKFIGYVSVMSDDNFSPSYIDQIVEVTKEITSLLSILDK